MDNLQLTDSLSFETETRAYKIRYTILGNPNGKPLVFVHGTPWSSKIWAPYAQAFAPKFRVYLLDNPGYGESPGATPVSSTTNNNDDDDDADLEVSLAAQAEAFAYCIKAWNLSEPPHVVAHDFGGIITLRGNLCHGVDYASLCLIDPLALTPFGSPFFALVASHPDVFNSVPDALAEGMIRSYIREAVFKPLDASTEDMLVQPWSRGGLQGKRGFIRQVAQASQRDVEEVMPRYGEVGKKMPVKIIWAKEDEWITVDRAERLAHMIGTDEVVIVENAGHLIHNDQPVRLAVELTSWLTKVAEQK